MMGKAVNTASLDVLFHTLVSFSLDFLFF